MPDVPREPVDRRPLGMDSRVAVQTASDRHHGDVYIKAGAAAARAVGTGAVHVEVTRVVELLRAAQASGASPDAVADAITRESVILGWVMKLIIPRSPEAFWALIASLLMIFQMTADTPPSPALDEERLGRAIAQAFEDAGIDPATVTPPRGVADWPDWKR